MNRTVIRVPLLIVYVFLSIQVCLFFIRSDSQGSYAPLAILFSWGALPGEYHLVSAPVGFWLIPPMYFLCLFSLATVCGRSKRLTFSLMPFLIHGVGVVIALMGVTKNVDHATDVTPAFLRASYVTAALLAGAYLLGDWWLARKPNKGAAPKDNSQRLL